MCAENYVVLQCTGLVSHHSHTEYVQLLAVVVPQFACRGDAGDGQTFRPKEKEKELAEGKFWAVCDYRTVRTRTVGVISGMHAKAERTRAWKSPV